MKLSIPAISLASALSTLAKSYHEDSLWILAARDSVTLTVDDLEARWSLILPANVEADGQAYTSLKRLMAYMPGSVAAPDTEIKLQLMSKNLAFESEKTKGHLPIVDSALFPVARALDKETTKVSNFERASFRDAVASCLSVVADVPGFAFTSGICIAATPIEGFLLATDRKQVIRRRFQCDGEGVKFTADAQQLLRAASQGGDTVICMADQRTCRFKNDQFTADLAQFTQNPPDVSGQFINAMRNCPHKAEISAPLLVDALKVCSGVGGDRDNFWAYLDMGPNGCALRANGDHIDELRIELGGTCTREIKIYIGYRALARTLSNFEKLGLVNNAVELKIDHERSPFFIQLGDEEEFYVYSPISPPGIAKEAP